MTIKIKIGGETTENELDILKQAFNTDNFVIEKNKRIIGMSSLPFVVSFVLGAIVSGVTYDLLKEGVLRLFQFRKKGHLKRVLIIKIILQDTVMIIKDDFYTLLKNEKIIDSGNINNMEFALKEILENDEQ